VSESGPAGERTSSLVADYDLGSFFDEMYEARGRPRRHYRELDERLGAQAQTDVLTARPLVTEMCGSEPTTPRAPEPGPPELRS